MEDAGRAVASYEFVDEMSGHASWHNIGPTHGLACKLPLSTASVARDLLLDFFSLDSINWVPHLQRWNVSESRLAR